MTMNPADIEFHTGTSACVDNLPTRFAPTVDDEQPGEVSLIERVMTRAETGCWYWNLDEGEIRWPAPVFPLPETVQGPFDYETFLSQVHHEDRAHVDDHWTAVTDGQSHQIEYRLNLADGTCWVRETVEVQTADDGSPHLAIGMLQDITEEKRRKRNNRLFREIVEHAGHSIFWTDKNGTIQYVNPAFERTTGYSFEEAVGETPGLLNSGEHDDEFYEDMWETITDGTVWSNEIINEGKDGDRYIISQTIAPIQNDHGEIERFVAVNSDITDRRRYEQELEILREAIDKAHVSITLTDPQQDDNPLVYVNEAFEKLTGYTESEVLGRNLRFLQGEETEMERRIALQDAIDNEDPFSIELRNYRKDGAMFWNKVTVTPIYDDDGSVVRFLGTQEDVTRRREHEQRLMVLNRVLRHNLRNKLSIIVGYASALKHTLTRSEAILSGQSDTQVDKIHTQLDYIIDNANKIARLGEKVRQFHQVVDEDDRTEPVQLGSALEDVASSYSSEFPDATIEIEGEPEVAILANRKAFKLAMAELVENAIVHNESDNPQITIVVSRSQTDAITVQIVDSGPGMPDIEQEVLTEGDESPLLHGSGFGLWMVNWLVVRFGGNVSIDESGSSGTVISVTFPTITSG